MTSTGEDVKKGEACALLVGLQTGAAAMENRWRFLKKSKTELQCDPAVPFWIYTQTVDIRDSRTYVHTRAHCGIIHSSQDTETTLMATDS